MKMSYLLIAALLASTFVCDGAQKSLIPFCGISFTKHVCSTNCKFDALTVKHGYHTMYINGSEERFMGLKPYRAEVNTSDGKIFLINSSLRFKGETIGKQKEAVETLSSTLLLDYGFERGAIWGTYHRNLISSNGLFADISFSDDRRTMFFEIIDTNACQMAKRFASIYATPDETDSSKAQEIGESLCSLAKDFARLIEHMAEHKVLRWFLILMVVGLVHGSITLFNNLTREFPDMSTTKKILIVFVTLCTCCVAGMAIGRSLTKRK